MGKKEKVFSNIDEFKNSITQNNIKNNIPTDLLVKRLQKKSRRL
jgi:hypothetical protein